MVSQPLFVSRNSVLKQAVQDYHAFWALDILNHLETILVEFIILPWRDEYAYVSIASNGPVAIMDETRAVHSSVAVSNDKRYRTSDMLTSTRSLKSPKRDNCGTLTIV